MKLLSITVLAALVTISSADSSCTISVPTIISSVPLPPTIESQLAQAYSYAADILNIGSIVSTIELTRPTLFTAESVVASYELSYESIISYIEEIYESPSLLPPSSVSSFSSLTAIHSTLASAIKTIVTIESSHTSLAGVQTALQYVEHSQPSILTYLGQYTKIASPTVYSDSHIIEDATITSPSIVPTWIEVYTAVSGYSAVISALSSLSSEMYTLPSTVDVDILTYIDSPDIISPTLLSHLSSCYPDVYTELNAITMFTKSHTSVVSAITNYLSAAEAVSSLGSAIYYIMTDQMPSLIYQISVMSDVSYYWPSAYQDIEFISELTATSPTLYRALTTIEQTFYESSSIASAILHAITSPSTVTSPTRVSYMEISHQSFVSALNEISSFESAYSTYAYTVCTILSHLTEAFKTERTLLTAASYISEATSPSTFSASIAIQTLFSVVNDLTTVMDEITSVIHYVPSLSCYEQTIEYYGWYYPEYDQALWEVYNSPSEITSSFSYYSELAADYSALATALYHIVTEESSYPLLDVAESAFLTAAESDSQVLTDFESLMSEESWLSSIVTTVSVSF
jgi:hypothetical protein